MKKAIVIVDSLFGNTYKLARNLSDGLIQEGVETDCLNVKEVNIDRLIEYDFIAIGGPTHMLGISKMMKDFLEELRSVDLGKKKGFCFDTRVESRFNRFDINSAAKKIEKIMKKMNIDLVHNRASAIVLGREGPLEEGAEQMFHEIGRNIAKKSQIEISFDRSTG